MLWELITFLAGDRFVVTRKLGFADHRLILLHLFLRVCVIAYVILWQICTMHQYAVFEPASAFGNLWDGYLANISTSRRHCSNSSYDWGKDFTPEEAALTGGLLPSNIQCVPFDRNRHILIDSNTFSAVTWETYVHANGSRRFVFTDAPEAAVMNLIHGFTASFLKNGIINPATSVSSKSGEHLKTYETGSIFGPVTMDSMLKLASVSLDSRNVQPWIRNGDPQQSPFFRITGLLAVMRITYSNLRQYDFVGLPGSGVPRADVTVEVLPNAWGFLGTAQTVDPATLAPVTVIRTGIKVQLNFAGQVGKLDLMELVRRLVEGIVLMGMAAFGTELVAEWVLYRGAYDGLTSERVHWDRLRAAVRLRAIAARVQHESTPAQAAPPAADLVAGPGGTADPDPDTCTPRAPARFDSKEASLAVGDGVPAVRTVGP